MAYRRTERVESRLQARRTAMLDAARTLLLEEGYAGASMQAVAQRAGTSIGNLYFYFARKDELLEAVVDDLLDTVAARADALCKSLPRGPAWIAGAAYAGTLAVFEERGLCARVLADPDASALRARALSRFVARFEARLRAHPALLGDQDPTLLALAVQGAMFHTLAQHLTSPEQVNEHVLARFLAGFALRSLGCPTGEVGPTVALVARAISSQRRTNPCKEHEP